MPASRRLLAITTCVALLHALALWALVSGLHREPAPSVVPVTLVADMVAATNPRAVPAAPAPTSAAPVVRMGAPQVAAQHPLPPAAAPATATAAAVTAVPTPTAPSASAVTALATAAGAGLDTGAAAAAAPSASSPHRPGGPADPGATTVRVELPSSDADYLRNPKPAYPPQSRRLGEQGQVVVRVLIGADGLPQRAQVHQTSGYDRLDQAAVATVLKWRYVPGKRAGVPDAMWFNVPINFVLE